MEEEALLRNFVNTDDKRAQVAFDQLCSCLRPRLATYLRMRCRCRDAQTCEDLVQETFLRLWNERNRFLAYSFAALIGYLQTVARRVYLDYLREEKRLPDGQGTSDYGELEQIPQEERSLIEQILLLHEAGWLLEQVDTALLSLPDLPPRERQRRLLAAQLFYLDNEPWESVLRFLNPSALPGETVTRSLLDEWLSDLPTLRLLAFRALYWDGAALVAHILNHAKAIWTEQERQIITWRFGQALRLDQILSRTDLPLLPQQIPIICDRSLSFFPFESLMITLRNRLITVVGLDPLTHRDLYQRLAFEYGFRDELAQRDILDRIAPAGKIVDYVVTPGMLNVWFGNRRLLEKVIRVLEGIEENDART